MIMSKPPTLEVDGFTVKRLVVRVSIDLADGGLFDTCRTADGLLYHQRLVRLALEAGALLHCAVHLPEHAFAQRAIVYGPAGPVGARAASAVQAIVSCKRNYWEENID